MDFLQNALFCFWAVTRELRKANIFTRLNNLDLGLNKCAKTTFLHFKSNLRINCVLESMVENQFHIQVEKI